MKVRYNICFMTAITSVFIPLAGLAFAQDQEQLSAKTRIENIENGLLPPVLVKGDSGWNIYERMKAYGVPGVSVAVIDDFKIAWAKGYGVKDITTNEPVDENTMFQAASISKSLNATAIMRKVQEGMLSLDEDVNEYLHSWKIPDNDFTANNKVTLANLLSHTAGITVGAHHGYSFGETIPTIQQILRGEFPAVNDPVTVTLEPGKTFNYSGGGTIISQLALMELENMPYPQIMEELILDPLEMTSSTFAQPLPGLFTERAATGHCNNQPVEGRFLIYPDLAAAGLWSTPGDLAKFAIEHQLSLSGKSNKILSQAMEEKMMAPYISDDYGLGFGLYGEKGNYFEHSGGNRGFASILFAHKTDGYGAVIMINSDTFDLIHEILRAVANEYKWKDYLPEPYEIVSVARERLTRYEGRYLINDDNVLKVREAGGRLYVERTGHELSEIFPISDSAFISKKENRRFIFAAGPDKERDTIEIISNDRKIIAPRIGKDKMVPYEYLMAGEIDKAIELYKSIQRSDASNALIEYQRIYRLAETLWFQKKIEEAIALLIVNTELYPDSEEAFRELAEACLMADKKELAIQSYEKILALDPRNKFALEKLKDLKQNK
ncbi:MAG: serine hydrolase [Candidatus Zixiibacteriota bacterium]|nr:MAG: serine hydrolase [candidate division Zixibacteria bacterium]